MFTSLINYCLILASVVVNISAHDFHHPDFRHHPYSHDYDGPSWEHGHHRSHDYYGPHSPPPHDYYRPHSPPPHDYYPHYHHPHLQPPEHKFNHHHQHYGQHTTTPKIYNDDKFKSTTIAATAPNFGQGKIDVRFGNNKNNDTKREKRATKTKSTQEQKRERRQNHPFWNRSNFYYFSEYSPCSGNSKCIPANACVQHPSSNDQICDWNNDEPYVCCVNSNRRSNDVSSSQTDSISKCNSEPIRMNRYSAAIVGGASVLDGTRYPWMVAIGERSKINGSINWYCGGAIIGAQLIVTAAHCVAERTADVIRVGEINLDSTTNSQEIPIRRTLVHPEYQAPLLYNDIAIVFLNKPIQYNNYVKPICLSNKKQTSSVALLTGWGQLNFGEQSATLQEITVQVFNNSFCAKQYSSTQASKRNFPNGIVETQLCAGDIENGKDACQGDSGAPLVAEENGSFALIGLVSAGIGCGSQFPGVYTRISAFRTWIIRNIRQ